MMGVRFPPEVEEALRRRAEAEDRHIAGIIRQAVRAYLAGDVEAVLAEDVEAVEREAVPA